MTATITEIRRSALSKRYWIWRWRKAKCHFCGKQAELCVSGVLPWKCRWSSLSHAVMMLDVLFPPRKQKK